MTDITPEAVEHVAAYYQYDFYHKDQDTAALLRALAARVAELEAELENTKLTHAQAFGAGIDYNAARVAELEAASAWPDISKAKKDGTSYLIVSGLDERRHAVEGYWREECKTGNGTLCLAGWVWCGDANVPKPYIDPDCFRELPTPPKG